MISRNLRYGALCVALCTPIAAYAQVAPLPSTAEAGRFERAIDAPQKAQSVRPDAQTDAAQKRTVAPPPGAEKLRFTLKTIQIEGMTRYAPQVLLAPYKKLEGKRVTVAKMYEVASSVLNRYSDDGYGFVLVYLPPQKIADGTVIIRVAEGCVHSVKLEGMQETLAVRQAIATLRAAKPLPNQLLEEQMLLVNDLPGMQVRAVVEPDKAAGIEGALKLRWIATKKQFEGSLSTNNYGSRYNGPIQMLASGTVNDALGRNDKTTVNLLGAVPLSEAKYVGIEHREQIGLRTSVGVQVSQSNNAPGYTLKPQEVKGKTQGISLDVQHKLLRSRAENLSVQGSVAATNYTTDILGTRLYQDKIRTAKLGVNYDTVDRLDGTNAVSVNVTQGLDVLGARKTGSADLSRAEGHSDFTKLEATAWRAQPVGKSWTLYGLATGQLASAPLLAAEEFGIGGSTIGRAFDVAELTGDHGLSGALEMRYLGLTVSDALVAQPFVFYDMGTVWNMDTNGKRASAAATGFGVRALIDKKIQMSATLALPLKHQPEAAQSSADKNPRLGVMLTVPF